MASQTSGAHNIFDLSKRYIIISRTTKKSKAEEDDLDINDLARHNDIMYSNIQYNTIQHSYKLQQNFLYYTFIRKSEGNSKLGYQWELWTGSMRTSLC